MMSMAMQGMVDEIIRERQGKGIRQVSDFVNPFEINAPAMYRLVNSFSKKIEQNELPGFCMVGTFVIF